MYEFETSLSLPLFKINTIVKFTKVKKPSGVSYFLLTLISEGLNKNQKLSGLLLEFGVPSDLHGIFARELGLLIENQILTYEGNYRAEYFQEYTLKHFKFTDSGRKVFQEEVLPLGYNEEIKQVVFYNPATKQLNTQLSDQISPNQNSYLIDDFYSKLTYPEDDIINDYFETQKGYTLSIKQEEVILNTMVQSVEFYQIKYPLRFSLDDNNQIIFRFDDQRLQSFFEMYYNKNLINSGLSFKNKFKFGFDVKNTIKISEQQPIEKILFPEEFRKETSNKSFLDIVSENNITSNSRFSFVNRELLEKYGNSARFIKVFDKDNAYVYIPAILSSNSQIFGEIKLGFLIVKSIDSIVIKQLVIDILNQFDKFIDDNDALYSFNNMLAISKFIQKIDLVDDKIQSWLSDDPQSNLVFLERLNNKIGNETYLLEKIRKSGLENFEKYLKDANIINLERKLNLSKWIIKANKISSVKLLEHIINSESFKDYGRIELYDLFERLEFSYEDIFVFMSDIVTSFFTKNKSKSKLAANISQVMDLLKTLKEITGINDINKYLLKENIDSSDFLKNYNRFNELTKEVDFIKKYAINQYNEITAYRDLFKGIAEIFAVEKNALSDPKIINEKLVDNKIKNGDIVSAVMYIYSKLSYICKSKYNINGDLADLIDGLEKKGIIKNDQSRLLHEFRHYRNYLVHANDKKVNFSTDSLSNVKSVVFKLEGAKK